MKSNPDRRTDSLYLDQRIKHIDDAELFASLDLDRPGLEKIRDAVARKDYPAAYAAWAVFWTTVDSRGKFQGQGSLIFDRNQATASFQNDRQTILFAAERILRHEIRGWGDVTIQHGPIVDFNANYGQSGKYGFHYWGFSTCLIQSYLLTGDQKYLAEFDRLFNQWYEQRDNVKGEFPNLDVIYYELGLGVRNRLFLEYYFLPYENRPTQTHERILKTVLGAARWLNEEQKLGYREGNWQIMGSYGLAHIGLIVPEFCESAEWVKLGTHRVSEHVERDFFADGCHSERSPASYMVTAYRDPRNLAKLLADHPQYSDLADKLRKPLERTLNWYLSTLPPDGVLPGINDGSRAPLLPTMMQDGHDLFGRRDMLWAKRHILGAETTDDGTEPKMRSVHFPASGFTVMRSDWSKSANYLLINHGPYGGGHSHADSLSFELHAHGRPLAIDSGIGRTYDDPAWNSWYVHSRAHNMLTVDGDDLARSAAEGMDVVWTNDDKYDYFAATHHGYETSKGIIHRRHILFVKPDYFVIFDEIESKSGGANHALEWNLHPTAPLNASHGPGMIVQLSSAEWTEKSDKGWASVVGIDGYGGKNEAEIDWHRFIGRIESGAKKTLGVLLYPFGAARPEVVFANGDREGDFTVKHSKQVDRIHFTGRTVKFTTEQA